MDEIEGEGGRDGAEGQGGGHSSTRPSDFPIFLTTLLPKTAFLNLFLKPKLKTQSQLSQREKEKKNNNNNKNSYT